MNRIDQALVIASRTDPGQVRAHNEDAVACFAAVGLVVLADGMGGHNAGEVASGMATAMLGNEIPARLARQAAWEHEPGGRLFAEAVLGEEVVRANNAIFEAARSQPQYAGMGTTLVAALFHDNRVTVAHVGDSRLYRLRGETFAALTKDHSLLQEQIDSGVISAEDAKHSRNKNLVTRALGVDPEVSPDLATHSVEVGDIYLLCSDGLNDMVDDEEIGSTLGMLAANPELAANQLVDLANDAGGRDNVSVILVKVTGDFSRPRGLRSFLSRWFGGWFR